MFARRLGRRSDRLSESTVVILTTGPWRRALLATRRHPALLGIALFAGVIVGIVAASPTMFVDSAGSGAVRRQWGRGSPTSNEAAVNWEPPTFDYRRFVEPTVASVGGFGDLDWTETTGRFNVVHDGNESTSACSPAPVSATTST